MERKESWLLSGKKVSSFVFFLVIRIIRNNAKSFTSAVKVQTCISFYFVDVEYLFSQ
ncbi:hypothetical protein [Vibrio gallaecicus]|uniref:hypothetical protein n=1 Tax=Vibrio gallaecicus TaxID=552386 RepID=UPI0025B51C11|nr:hypothetical protein [Vibrio gallaecicus]MDN3617588.1 hypothetical protein [Vibrio gallaecicus]